MSPALPGDSSPGPPHAGGLVRLTRIVGDEVLGKRASGPGHLVIGDGDELGSHDPSRSARGPIRPAPYACRPSIASRRMTVATARGRGKSPSRSWPRSTSYFWA